MSTDARHQVIPITMRSHVAHWPFREKERTVLPRAKQWMGHQKKKKQSQTLAKKTLTFRRRIARTRGAAFRRSTVRRAPPSISTTRAPAGRCKRAGAGAPGTGRLMSKKRSAAADAEDEHGSDSNSKRRQQLGSTRAAHLPTSSTQAPASPLCDSSRG